MKIGERVEISRDFYEKVTRAPKMGSGEIVDIITFKRGEKYKNTKTEAWQIIYEIKFDSGETDCYNSEWVISEGGTK